MALEAKHWTGVSLDSPNTLPLVLAPISPREVGALIHLTLLPAFIPKRNVLLGRPIPGTLQLLCHTIELVNKVIGLSRFRLEGGGGLSLPLFLDGCVVRMVDVVLVLPTLAAHKLILIKQSPHAKILLVDDAALLPEYFHIRNELIVILGKVINLPQQNLPLLIPHLMRILSLLGCDVLLPILVIQASIVVIIIALLIHLEH